MIIMFYLFSIFDHLNELLMKKILCIAILIAFNLIGCKSSDKSATKKRTEVLEIFEATANNASAEAGPLKYFESTEFNGLQKSSVTYYDNLGKIKGKEVFDYSNESDSLALGSSYFDPNNKLLSYYKNVYDKKGRLVAAYAFDAASNELLRIEQYTYKVGQALKNSKRIFNSDYTPDRRYAFTYDEFNNETGFSVYNALDSLAASEEYRILKRDENNMWTEKWGFANGKPTTLHKRSLK
jgi:hypothetical protein